MSLIYKGYKNYEEYISHQGSKLKQNLQRFLDLFDKRYKIIFSRIKDMVDVSGVTGGKVLCLGARRGEEVKAFRELGFSDSIGIDLYPGPDNQYVITGDFHSLDYPSEHFDVLYTNSPDHAFDLDKMISECDRVLKKNGALLLEVSKNVKHTPEWKDHRGRNLIERNSWESLLWNSPEDVIELFKKVGNFEEAGRCSSNQIGVILKKKEKKE
jgi:SAM-dependent methyltransferase